MSIEIDERLVVPPDTQRRRHSELRKRFFPPPAKGKPAKAAPLPEPISPLPAKPAVVATAPPAPSPSPCPVDPPPHPPSPGEPPGADATDVEKLAWAFAEYDHQTCGSVNATFPIAARVCARALRTSMDVLRSPDRHKALAHIRQMAASFIYEATGRRSTNRVGRLLNRDHSTIVHAKKKCADLIASARELYEAQKVEPR